MRIAESAIVTTLFLIGIVIANHIGTIFRIPRLNDCATPVIVNASFEVPRAYALTLEN